jgi:hypothetical protein
MRRRIGKQAGMSVRHAGTVTLSSSGDQARIAASSDQPD